MDRPPGVTSPAACLTISSARRGVGRLVRTVPTSSPDKIQKGLTVPYGGSGSSSRLGKRRHFHCGSEHHVPLLSAKKSNNNQPQRTLPLCDGTHRGTRVHHHHHCHWDIVLQEKGGQKSRHTKQCECPTSWRGASAGPWGSCLADSGDGASWVLLLPRSWDDLNFEIGHQPASRSTSRVRHRALSLPAVCRSPNGGRAPTH